MWCSFDDVLKRNSGECKDVRTEVEVWLKFENKGGHRHFGTAGWLITIAFVTTYF